ncbi:hypothetical protein CNEO2_620021 [Clostridium neonatale]|nr:hypothetical protein CNEO2_620021 [Clostridium neonatale]CAI3631107.1 hypothetical protein CNEO4_600021 [Clostridium neonatale]
MKYILFPYGNKNLSTHTDIGYEVTSEKILLKVDYNVYGCCSQDIP